MDCYEVLLLLSAFSFYKCKPIKSKYTAGWIENIYGKKAKSDILYPPVDIEKFHTSSIKANNIIVVDVFCAWS